MQYVINANPVPGRLTGIDPGDITNLAMDIRRRLGVNLQEVPGVNNKALAEFLTNDAAIIDAARASYQPDPADPGWTEEERAAYRQQLAAGTAPGRGEVAEALVANRLTERISQLGAAWRAELEAKFAQRERDLEGVDWKITAQREPASRGGQTAYQHIMEVGGDNFVFNERCAAEPELIISPGYAVLEGLEPGGIAARNADGVYSWLSSDSREWLRNFTDNEEKAYLVVAKYGVYAGEAR